MELTLTLLLWSLDMAEMCSFPVLFCNIVAQRSEGLQLTLSPGVWPRSLDENVHLRRFKTVS